MQFQGMGTHPSVFSIYRKIAIFEHSSDGGGIQTHSLYKLRAFELDALLTTPMSMMGDVTFVELSIISTM